MKKSAKHFRGYIKETILSPLFKLCEATLELIVPLVIAKIIDIGIVNKDTGYIVKMCLVLVLLGIIGLALSLTAQYFAAKSAVGFTTSLKKTLFNHLESLSYKDIDTLGTSTIITRMTTDASRVQSGINLTLRLLLRSPFVVFGAMIMAFSINIDAGVIFAITIPLLAIIVFGIMAITTPMHGKVQGVLDKILAKTRENLSGARVIRAFAKEDAEVEDFNDKNDSLTLSQKNVGYISALLNPLTFVIINIFILILIYTGAVEVDSSDELTQGGVIALYNYMSQILVELIKLANLIITISKAIASLNRINSVIDTPSTQKFGTCDEEYESEYAIELRNASLRYPHASEDAITDINVKVKRGDMIGIIGGTGSGKTSLVNLIPRLYDVTSGEVILFGKNIYDYTKEFLTSKISIVPQKAVLFSGTIRDNMLWRKTDASDEEILNAISIAQATNILNNKDGLDTKIEAEGKNLSGGQRQRLTIARALIGNPEVLILDDSASALDYATDSKLNAALKTIKDNTTIFIVSQRASSVIEADKIIVLDDGKVSSIGPHDELLVNCPIYKEIYESQFGEVSRA